MQVYHGLVHSKLYVYTSVVLNLYVILAAGRENLFKCYNVLIMHFTNCDFDGELSQWHSCQISYIYILLLLQSTRRMSPFLWNPFTWSCMCLPLLHLLEMKFIFCLVYIYQLPLNHFGWGKWFICTYLICMMPLTVNRNTEHSPCYLFYV